MQQGLEHVIEIYVSLGGSELFVYLFIYF